MHWRIANAWPDRIYTTQIGIATNAPSFEHLRVFVALEIDQTRASGARRITSPAMPIRWRAGQHFPGFPHGRFGTPESAIDLGSAAPIVYTRFTRSRNNSLARCSRCPYPCRRDQATAAIVRRDAKALIVASTFRGLGSRCSKSTPANRPRTPAVLDGFENSARPSDLFGSQPRTCHFENSRRHIFQMCRLSAALRQRHDLSVALPIPK